MLPFAVVALTLALGAGGPPSPPTPLSPPSLALPDSCTARTSLTTFGPRPIVRFPAPLAVDTPPPRPRPRAVEYSDAYYTRLKVHRYVSFAVYPLAVAEYFVGQKLYNNPSGGVKSTHLLLATGLSAAFAVNTVTGAMNLYESRKDPSGRARRYIHTILMLASDAGFVAAAATGPHRERFEDQFGGFFGGGLEGNPSTHRALAFGAMGVGVASSLMMMIWR